MDLTVRTTCSDGPQSRARGTTGFPPGCGPGPPGRRGPDWPGTDRHVRRPEGRSERTASTPRTCAAARSTASVTAHRSGSTSRASACCTASVCGESPAEPTRKNLRFAYEQFSVPGAHTFAERARIELLATGEELHPCAAGGDRQLTRQEEEIARLTAEGRTNIEIGVAVFISPRTFEWHLGKVFLKLPISSRRELRDPLRPADREG
jgi:DNA-binding CsgD family transcriptional regulator